MYLLDDVVTIFSDFMARLWKVHPVLGYIKRME